MVPDSTSYRQIIANYVRRNISTFITDFRKLSFAEIKSSRMVKLFIGALLFSELFGLLVAVFCVSFLRDHFFAGVCAVGSATAVSYRSTNIVFYWVLWPLVRILSGQAKCLWGDYVLFVGMGCSLDIATVSLQGTLGLLLLKVTGSEFWATALATILQMLLYIPLATIFVAGRIMREEKTK